MQETNQSLSNLVESSHQMTTSMQDALATMIPLHELFTEYPDIIPIRTLLDLIRVNEYLMENGADSFVS